MNPDNMFEKILHNPGLQHLAENIFDNLKFEDLVVSREINQSSKRILDYQMDKPSLTSDKPMFLLRKFRSLSKLNQKDWIKVIQSEKNSDKGKAISFYLQWNLKKEALVDLPCYSSPAVQNDFRMKIWDISNKWEISSDEDMEIVKMLAPLTENPNAPDKNGKTPIHWAAFNGHNEIVKILVPLTDNPNVPDNYGHTPIHQAACGGHTEIVKILESFKK